MNYFVITEDRNKIRIIKENYAPLKHFNLLDRDLTKDEFFTYVIDIMDEVYRGNNVLISTTNRKGIKNLFETINNSEAENYCTVFMTDSDDTDYFKATKIDNIITEN